MISSQMKTSINSFGEGTGNPLQCSCLENPRDGGAWWAAIYGVAQSRTRLRDLAAAAAAAKTLYPKLLPLTTASRKQRLLISVFTIM